MQGTHAHSDAEFYRIPTKAENSRLLETHGIEAVHERWWYLHRRTLYDIRIGKVRQPA